jgi:hypothetical protein
MVQTLAFNPEGTKTQPLQRPNKLVWTVAQVPRISIADLLRHRMSDPAIEASVVKVRVSSSAHCLQGAAAKRCRHTQSAVPLPGRCWDMLLALM